MIYDDKNIAVGHFSSIILPILQDEEYMNELYEKYLYIKEELYNNYTTSSKPSSSSLSSFSSS